MAMVDGSWISTTGRTTPERASYSSDGDNCLRLVGIKFKLPLNGSIDQGSGNVVPEYPDFEQTL